MNLNACCVAQREKKFLKLDRHELQVEELLFIDSKKKLFETSRFYTSRISHKLNKSLSFWFHFWAGLHVTLDFVAARVFSELDAVLAHLITQTAQKI